VRLPQGVGNTDFFSDLAQGVEFANSPMSSTGITNLYLTAIARTKLVFYCVITLLHYYPFTVLLQQWTIVVVVLPGS
jgi:hypothetical protein